MLGLARGCWGVEKGRKGRVAAVWLSFFSSFPRPLGGLFLKTKTSEKKKRTPEHKNNIRCGLFHVSFLSLFLYDKKTLDTLRTLFCSALSLSLMLPVRCLHFNFVILITPAALVRLPSGIHITKYQSTPPPQSVLPSHTHSAPLPQPLAHAPAVPPITALSSLSKGWGGKVETKKRPAHVTSSFFLPTAIPRYAPSPWRNHPDHPPAPIHLPLRALAYSIY